MPRRAAASIRPIEPDPVHRSRLVSQVVNKVMLDGKKSTAERIVYDALAIVGEKTGKDPIEQLEASIKSLTPALEARTHRCQGGQRGPGSREPSAIIALVPALSAAHVRARAGRSLRQDGDLE